MEVCNPEIKWKSMPQWGIHASMSLAGLTEAHVIKGWRLLHNNFWKLCIDCFEPFFPLKLGTCASVCLRLNFWKSDYSVWTTSRSLFYDSRFLFFGSSSVPLTCLVLRDFLHWASWNVQLWNVEHILNIFRTVDVFLIYSLTNSVRQTVNQFCW